MPQPHVQMMNKCSHPTRLTQHCLFAYFPRRSALALPFTSSSWSCAGASGPRNDPLNPVLIPRPPVDGARPARQDVLVQWAEMRRSTPCMRYCWDGTTCVRTFVRDAVQSQRHTRVWTCEGSSMPRSTSVKIEGTARSYRSVTDSHRSGMRVQCRMVCVDRRVARDSPGQRAHSGLSRLAGSAFTFGNEP